MDLRERLRLLRVAGSERARQTGSLACDAAPYTPPAQEFRDGFPRAAVAGGCLEGYLANGSAGEAFYLETRYPVEYLRGPFSLRHVLTIPGEAWELLGRVPASVRMDRAVYFDTETTGLAGGTGTYAFLVGLGYFEGADFVLKQYFLRDYPEEDAMLEALAADLSRFALLVTFNGKSFDWPLMETRYRLARRKVPLFGVPHLDLLHPARRLWRARLAQCNLTSLEAQVLGVRRVGDVPGHLIPQLYFDYLRSGDATPLLDVVLHNRLDILSLVSLATWLGRIATDPLSPTPDGELVPGDDLFALARLLEQRGRLEEALPLYEATVERGAIALSPALLMSELARCYKRLRRLDRALAVWERMVADPALPSLHALVEMAKYYEHTARDIDQAHALASQALRLAEQRRTVAPFAGDSRNLCLELEHRLNRLVRKQQRQ